ncbi:MAG TPA: hypothetical protein VFX97_15740 [Pyrinomonadaceae bacterium]|nr:hypothetical protein [Pyrinomonadaceae bacterium]
MNKTRSARWFRPIAVITSLALTLVAMINAGVDAQAPRPALSVLTEHRDDVVRRLPSLSEAKLAAAKENSARSPLHAVPGATQKPATPNLSCAADTANPLSSLVAEEDNPVARALEGFVLRDKHGRRTRPWRALKRAEQEKRGTVVHRPLLVFLETPTHRQDFNKPWYGPVRFDRPGFPTTKEAIAEQVFGKNFDHRDPASVAGFYFRESGGKLVIKGDASSIHTVLVPHMTFDSAPMVEAILQQVDPIVDFTKRADEFGWADPIFIMTPYSFVLDYYDYWTMGEGHTYRGYGPTVYDKAPAITNDKFPDGSHAAIATVAISMVGLHFGASQAPWHAWFGLPEDQTRDDDVALYAHEYGHNLGLSHMMTSDFAQSPGESGRFNVIGRMSPSTLNRWYGSGFATTIMNYSYGSGGGPDLVPRGSQQAAGLDPMNRSKLGWGNVVEVTLTEDNGRAGPRELAPGDERRIDLVEHLGHGPNDPKPEILKVNLPPQRVSLFPQRDAAGNPSGYWRPGPETRRMVWSGRPWGGSRMMETSLEIPADLDQPVLTFWTKYGLHGNRGLYPPGYDFGWIQISTDDGNSWTSLAGQTTNTYVQPERAGYHYFGEDLGAPALTGDSRQFGPNGWILERVPLPLPPSAKFRLRFNFNGYGLSGINPSQDFGWWIDDVYLGTPAQPTKHLVSDFEGEDVRRWQGLLTEFNQGAGFVVVEQTSPFPQAYFFELRGNNTHDEIAFKEQHPKELNGYLDVATYTYSDGVVGYFANQYATFWAHPEIYTGSATHEQVPIERLLRGNVSYPYGAGVIQLNYVDFGGAFAAASDPNSGVTLDDVVFLFTLPHESFGLADRDYGWGFAYPIIGENPVPSAVTLLDATPTYRPPEVTPASPETPFPERPSSLWPYVKGSPGGWPKTAGHGPLGLSDPTTTTVLGQPFLARDAAFHPQANARFDDRGNYPGSFATEFNNWHRQPTHAAFASTVRSERFKSLLAGTVPVSETESIDYYYEQYCPQNASGSCVAPDQAVQRPWIEQILYERLAFMSFLINIGSCPRPPNPQVFTIETKPAWDAMYACFVNAADGAHTRTNQLLEVARNLGHNPRYAWLNSFGNQGTLSPGLWTEFYLDAWARAKGPEPVPSFGFSMEVERITKAGTPEATLKLRRSTTN